MSTEEINLTVGGNEYNASIDFSYTPEVAGSSVSPPSDEGITIYKISLEVATNIWATMDDEYTDFAKEQVLDWIHTKQEDSELENKLRDHGHDYC